MRLSLITTIFLILLSVIISTSDAASSVRRSVFVFRHCVRSTTYGAYSGLPNLTNFNNFTNKTFPDWPVEAYQCLPNGIEKLKNMGRVISKTIPYGPVKFEVDGSCKRDNDTASALLNGMNMKKDDYVSVPELFDPISYGHCSPIDSTVAENAVRERFETFPLPDKHEERLRRMQSVLGKGVAPPLDEIPDKVATGAYLNGGSSVTSSFAEAFLMQLGNSMEVAWGEITRDDVYDFLTTHIYARGVADRVFPLISHSHTMMSNRIVQFLEDDSLGSEERANTLILVGHDGDLDALAVMFGLSWHTSPFPPNATTPGSAIRFDLLDDIENTIQTSILYQIFDNTMDVHTSPAWFDWLTDDCSTSSICSSSTNSATLGQIKKWLAPRLDSTCE